MLRTRPVLQIEIALAVLAATRVERRPAQNTSEAAAEVVGDRESAFAYSAEQRLPAKIGSHPPHRIVRLRFLVTPETRVVPSTAFESDSHDIQDRAVMNATRLLIHETPVNLDHRVLTQFP